MFTNTDSKKPDDDHDHHESEETLSLCDLPMHNKNDFTDDNYQYFSKEEDEMFEFVTTNLQTNTNSLSSIAPDDHKVSEKMMMSLEGERTQKPERELGKKRVMKNDSMASTSSRRHTHLLLILLGIPPKTQSEMEVMIDIRNRQSQHGPATFFKSSNSGKRDDDSKVRRGFWRMINVASCFGGQFTQSPAF